jgi:hypothetical protein
MFQSRQQLLSRGLRGSIALFATTAIIVGAVTSDVSAQAGASSPAQAAASSPAQAAASSHAARAKQPVRPVAVALEQAPNAASAFGSALLACDKDAGAAADAIALPGVKGDLKLDKCYRGRDHLLCNLNVLTKEATALSQEFSKIIDAGYPDLGNISAVCAIKPDNLGSDMSRANEFTNRFRALKAAYTARMSCTGRIQQQLREVTLPDMTQAPDVLKSMVDGIEGDSKELVALQAQVADLATKIEASEKAMMTIQKVSVAVCPKDRTSVANAEEGSKQ